MTQTTDGVIVFVLLLLFLLYEEVKALINPQKQRVLPTKKSKTELKKMLKGELVELVVSYQQ